MSDDIQADDTRACPHCGERVKKQAIKCRHCGESLTGKPLPGAGNPQLKALEDSANLAMILGIIGVVVCNLLGPFAIWKGNEAKRTALSMGREVPGAATAGIILGWIGTVLLILILLLFLVAIILVVLGR